MKRAGSYDCTPKARGNYYVQSVYAIIDPFGNVLDYFFKQKEALDFQNWLDNGGIFPIKNTCKHENGTWFSREWPGANVCNDCGESV
jgi:hypothetical protein